MLFRSLDLVDFPRVKSAKGQDTVVTRPICWIVMRVDEEWKTRSSDPGGGRDLDEQP